MVAGGVVRSVESKWEVVVFSLGKETFAINVNKTREILRWTGCRPIPKMSPAFVGITTVRGVALPLVDLRLFLGIDSPISIEHTKVMIVEFNDVRLGFLVDSVERIHRVGADDLDASLTGSCLGPWVLYVIKRDARNILMLDYEAIVQQIAPSIIEQNLDEGRIGALRSKVGDVDNFRILMADDSPLLRQQTRDVLTKSGFTMIDCVRDGAEAYELLITHGEHFNLLITDVEMPRMDGLSLVEALRKSSLTKDMPVIIYSSIMVQDIISRGENLNIHSRILKPNIYKLLEHVVDVYNETCVLS